MARALVQKPRILLADEPIASLDPGNATRVMETLRTINAADGPTVLVILPSIDTARTYCQRIIGLRQGRVFFDDTPRQLTDDVLRDNYASEGLSEFSESVTSTSVRAKVPA